MNTSTHEVWFAAEFFGRKAPVFEKTTDVTWWDGVKFFHKKEDAIAYAHLLAKENMKSLIRDNIEYENVFEGEGLDVFNWNRLVDRYSLKSSPYLLVDKYEVEGKVHNNFTTFIIEWEEEDGTALKSIVAKCFPSRKEALAYAKEINLREYVHAYSNGLYREEEIFIEEHDVI